MPIKKLHRSAISSCQEEDQLTGYFTLEQVVELATERLEMPVHQIPNDIGGFTDIIKGLNIQPDWFTFLWSKK